MVTAERKVLVLLDNVDEPSQIKELRPGRGGAVIATSSQALAGLTADIVLRRLFGIDAEALLGRLVAESRLLAEPDALHELVRLCDGRPFALQRAWLSRRTEARSPWRGACTASRGCSTNAGSSGRPWTVRRRLVSWTSTMHGPPCTRSPTTSSAACTTGSGATLPRSVSSKPRWSCVFGWASWAGWPRRTSGSGWPTRRRTGASARKHYVQAHGIFAELHDHPTSAVELALASLDVLPSS